MSTRCNSDPSVYQYDPLDRLAASNSLHRFYNNTRIATEIEGTLKSCFFETHSYPLAVQQQGVAHGTTLLATDQHASVLNGVSPEGYQQMRAYLPFGYHTIGAALAGWGFNGERPEPITGHYLLAQGYRAFNPVLMRFNSPDSWSPFGKGGINMYAYCTDPINNSDPSGHWVKRFLRSINVMAPPEIKTNRLIATQNKQTEQYAPLVRHYKTDAKNVDLTFKRLSERNLIEKRAFLNRKNKAISREMYKAQQGLISTGMETSASTPNDLGIKLFNVSPVGSLGLDDSQDFRALLHGIRHVQSLHQIRHRIISIRLANEGRGVNLPNAQLPYWDRYFGTDPRRGS
ncbi:RHS repeat-associated core domain-containing protein [Pseudomonas sp. SIMBA_077]